MDIRQFLNGFVQIKLDSGELGSAHIEFGWTWVSSSRNRVEMEWFIISLTSFFSSSHFRYLSNFGSAHENLYMRQREKYINDKLINLTNVKYSLLSNTSIYFINNNF